MIGLLNQNVSKSEALVSDLESAIKAEDQLIEVIYRFAREKDEWFNLLLGLSNCIAVADTLPRDHPYQQVATRIQQHLKTALSISVQLSVGSVEDLQSETLSRLPVAAAIIDAQGRMVAINQGGEDYLAKLELWRVEDGVITIEGERISKYLGSVDDEILEIPLEHEHKALLCHLSGERGNVSQRFYLCFEAPRSSLIHARALKRDFGLTQTEILVTEAVIVELSTEKASQRLRL